MRSHWFIDRPDRPVLIVAQGHGAVPENAERVSASNAAWHAGSWVDALNRALVAEIHGVISPSPLTPLTLEHEVIEAIEAAFRLGHLVAYLLPGALSGGQVKPGPAPGPAPPQPQPQLLPWTLVSLVYVPNIAPDKESPKPKIKWTIKDPSVRVTSGKFELLRTRDPADPAPIWTLNLTPDQLREGDHELEWDGAIGGGGDFPDGFVSIEFSPYKLKLSVTDGSAPQTKDCSFEVVVVDFEIALGDKAVLSDQKDKDLHDKIGSLPGAGAIKKIQLVSNVFKTSSGEMSAASGASFTEYSALWGDGPRIPIDAKVWIKDSQGKKVLAPKAWGRRTILWDWECDKPSLAALPAAAKTFVDTAQNFNKATTKPNGENCHKDRGGKRATDGKPVVFSSDAGGTFPFTVKQARKRVQASFSDPAKTGPKDGLSGVVLRPARQAGEGWKVTAYFDAKKDLDVEGAVTAAFKKDAGIFEVWREIHLSKYIKKKASITGFTAATVQAYYEKAWVKIEDKTGGASAMDKASYDAAFTTAIAAQPAICNTHAVDPAVSQYDGGDWAVTFRSFADFQTSVINEKKTQLKAATPALVDPALTVQATAAATAQLTAANLHTASKYADQCTNWALNITVQGCSSYMGANDGVTIMQFNETNSNTGSATSLINGYAPTFSTSSRSRAAFIQYSPAARYAAGGDSNTMEQTLSHEVGHHMFLPHAPLPPSSLPGGADAAAHDQADLFCMMGYDFSAERKFCGLCLLRMRGWDHRKLDKDGTKNKAP